MSAQILQFPVGRAQQLLRLIDASREPANPERHACSERACEMFDALNVSEYRQLQRLLEDRMGEERLAQLHRARNAIRALPRREG